MAASIRKETYPIYRSPEDFVKAELKIMDAGFKRVMRNKASMKAFLIRIGVLDKKGRPTKPYR